MWMSPTVVWIVAEFAMGEGPEGAAGVADATVCSSRLGRSLKTSRSPLLVCLSREREVVFNYCAGRDGDEGGSLLWF